MWQNELEKMFHNEVREKKKTASGVHHKTGKNGYVGKMRFPSDIMSRKDKMRYRRSSKVMITNMYDEILTVEEFEKLETHEQRNRLAYWRNKYSNKEITETMGIWNARYYKLVAELGLPKARRINETKKPRKASANKKSTLSEAITTPPAPIPAAPPAPPAPMAAAPPAPVVQEVIVDGLHLSFVGTYNAEKIQRQMAKFDLLLEGEEDDFYIEMKIMQRAAKRR